MSDCLFCKIAAGEIPSTCLYSDEEIYVFQDIAPQAPVHFLVIPRVHIPSAASITGENGVICARIFEVIAKLAAEMGLNGFRVVTNSGISAGQTVEHLHFHVLSGRTMDQMG